MEDSYRQTINEVLTEIEKLQLQVIGSVDTPAEGSTRSAISELVAFEGSTRSAINELVAFRMSEFGTFVADVEAMGIEEADTLAFMREKRKIDLMNKEDPQTDKPYTSTKAQSKIELLPEIREQLAKVRSLKHSHAVLSNKSKSMWEWLGHSRSRLSWIGREVHHGAS